MQSTEVAIIGGGVIGAATAYFLAKRGHAVTVIEQDKIAAGASGHGPGFFNCFGGDFVTGDHLNFGLESVRIIREVRAELEQYAPEHRWFNERPGIAPAFTQEAYDNVQELYLANGPQLEASDAGAKWVEGKELREIEPLLAEHVLGGFVFPSVIQIDGWKLTELYMRAAVDHGAKTIFSGATGLISRDSSVTTVRLANGEHVSAEHVVLAMGSWTPIASTWLGFPLPICNLKGQLHVLRAENPVDLGHHIIERVAVMQYPDGDYLLAATPDPAPGGGLLPTDAYIRPLSDTDAWPQDTTLLYETGRERFPFLNDASVVKDLAGGRPVSPDLLPMIGRTPVFDNVTVATGHGRKGIHLSAATGTAVADLVTGKPSSLSVDLQSFSPMRFMPPKM